MLCMSSVEREQTRYKVSTGTGTVIFEGSTVNNINNKWRGIERVERGCFGGGLFELTRWIK